MSLELPTAFEMRRKISFERTERLRKERADRIHASWLIFYKGGGKIMKLNSKDRKFVQMVMKKSYYEYLEALRLGRPKPALCNARNSKFKYKSTIGNHKSYLSWRKRWYGGAKLTYRRWLVPKIAKARLEAAIHGNRNSPLPEF